MREKLTEAYRPRRTLSESELMMMSFAEVLRHAETSIQTWTVPADYLGNPTLLQTQRGTVIYGRTPADAMEQSVRWQAGRQTVSDLQRPRRYESACPSSFTAARLFTCANSASV